MPKTKTKRASTPEKMAFKVEADSRKHEKHKAEVWINKIHSAADLEELEWKDHLQPHSKAEGFTSYFDAAAFDWDLKVNSAIAGDKAHDAAIEVEG